MAETTYSTKWPTTQDILAAMERVSQMAPLSPPPIVRTSEVAFKVLEQTLPIMRGDAMTRLCGMKVIIDPTMADGEVEIRSGTQRLRIVNLCTAHK